MEERFAMGHQPMAACLQTDPARPLASQDRCAAAGCKELLEKGAFLSRQCVAAFELNLAGQRDFPPPSATQKRRGASRFQIELRKRMVDKPVACPVEVRGSAFGKVMNFLERKNLGVRIRPLQGVNDRVWGDGERVREFVLIGVPQLPEFAAHRSRRASQCCGAHLSRSLPEDRRKPPQPYCEGCQ